MSNEPASQPAEGRSMGGLHGRRVVVTRAPHQAAEMAELLKRVGADAVLYPCLAILPPEDLTALDDALRQAAAGNYDRLVLTSANTVLILVERLAALGLSLRDLPVAAVGPKTAEAAVESLGLEVDLVAEEHLAEGLAAVMAPVSGHRLLLPQSAIARPVLAELLAAAGAQVTVITAYRTGLGQGGAAVPALLAARQIDAVTFTSSSTVANFLTRLEQEGADRSHLAGVCLAAIGPVTAKMMARHELTATVIPDDYTLPGLIAALEAYFTIQ